jgi:hypothetical protein
MNAASTRSQEHSGLVYTPEGQALQRRHQDLADQMRYELGRYRAWRCHQDPIFQEQLHHPAKVAGRHA